MAKAYLVYPGLGKTTLANKNPDFIDIETKIFKDLSLAQYIGKKDYPNYRGQKIEKINLEYPANIQEYTRKQIAEGKIILLVFKQDSLDLLKSLGINDYKIVLPSIERLEQLKKDYINRGDDLNYIENNMTMRYNQVLIESKESGKEITFLRPEQYLENII